MWGNKILLVDDEESILKSFCMDFKQEGYNVTIASSGEEAVKEIQAHHFDMVVTDLSMSGMDGIAVLVEAKKHNPYVGAIILTGYGDTASAIDALRLCADDYLFKPCDSEELLLRTAHCLKNKEAFQKVAFYENILPVCMYCKSIRDDRGATPGNGKWMPMEEYINVKSGTDISHTFCPNCQERAAKDMALDE